MLSTESKRKVTTATKPKIKVVRDPGRVMPKLVLPAIIKGLKDQVPHVVLRRKIYRVIVDSLEAEGWEAAEFYRDLDPAYDQYLDEVWSKR